MPAGHPITSICAGAYFGLGLTSTGTVYSWGYNGAGQIGDGTTRNRPVPVPLRRGTTAGLGRVTQLACGGNFALALTATGQLIGWGADDAGQLEASHKGADVLQPNKLVVPGWVRIKSIGAIALDSLVLTTTNRILDWGWNAFGQLGNGHANDQSFPVEAELGPGRQALAIGAGPDALHVFAIMR
jgi:alpha-tubulin suppressor-like RCC1 family protein